MADELLALMRGLHLWRQSTATPPARRIRTLLSELAAGRSATAQVAYLQAFRLLAHEGWSGDGWRAHLACEVVADAALRDVERHGGPGLLRAAQQDLATLQRLADPAPWGEIREALTTAGWVALPWHDLGQRQPQGLAARLVAARDWPALLPALLDHARAGGAGRYARHWAYRWDRRRGRLQPVIHPDLPCLGLLFGYEAQKQALRANTERLLAGLPAQDVLLYGDRGTGKSSLVKALLPLYAPRGLRLVEVGRTELPELPRLFARLADQPQRFIIFVDDLSFEEGETTYKEAKAALEGGIAGRPPGVVVYATSNRRHLIRERFSERAAPEEADDPRAGDAVEEKLSLADRFGLTLLFPQPDQALYLQIVEGLAAARGLALPPEVLRQRALRWALRYNGRSGRTARQFIDAEIGEGAPAGPDRQGTAQPPRDAAAQRDGMRRPSC